MNSGTKLGIVTFLTLLRVPLVLVFFVGALVYSVYRVPGAGLNPGGYPPGPAGDFDWLFALAFTCLIASTITDAFDGWLARRFNVVTKFGAHADPLMDKFFYLATFPLLIFVAVKNAWGPVPHLYARTHAVFLLVLTLLFLARDQWVTFLRSIGSIYNVSGQAHWSGKWRTIITFPLVCAIYLVEEAPPRLQLVPMWLLYAFEILALGINILSVSIYTRHYWPYLRRSADFDPNV